MYIENFGREHVADAMKIARKNYEEECKYVLGLPNADIPDLTVFADNGMGVALMDEEEGLRGFMCAYGPFERAFGTAAAGVYSPVHANGVLGDEHGAMYRRMYQAAAEKWVNAGARYHCITLYAHDMDAAIGMFVDGFGMRCMDAIRPIETLPVTPMAGVTYRELDKSEIPIIRDLRASLEDHLTQSPCFMKKDEGWLARAESRESRLFGAFHMDKCVAFLEVGGEGENFASAHDSVRNICGAFCRKEYRGGGLMAGLLNHTISGLRDTGAASVGVDFESINPTAYGFWLKTFYAYTRSITRRIDE